MPQVNLPEADFSMIKKEHSEVLLPFTLTYQDANKLTQKKWAKKWYQKPIGGNSFPVMIENLTFVPEKNHHIKAIAEISGTIKGLLHIKAKCGKLPEVYCFRAYCRAFLKASCNFR